MSGNAGTKWWWLVAISLIPCHAWSQGRRDRQTHIDPVVVPEREAMAAKRALLSRISKPRQSVGRSTNVVLILADDLGYGDTAVYGSGSIPTPHIDALAAGGVRFTEAYVTAASCSPSRAGLVSGRYQQRFGFEFNTSGGAITDRESRGLDPAVVTIADVFERAGYATAVFGKWHLGTRDYFHPLNRGFQEFFGFLAGAHSFFPVEDTERIFATVMRGTTPMVEPEYLTDAFAREAVRFIGAHASDPFFLYVPFNAVHTPLEASSKYLQRFPNEPDERKRAYQAMTSALDDAVGRIVSALQAAAVREHTLVIFLNDNGGPIYTGVQSNGPLRLGKLFLFEGGVRVPMIMDWPNATKAAGVYRRPVSSLDVFPTACAAAGIAVPDELKLDGVDLLPFVCGGTDTDPHSALFWSNGPNRAIRKGRWKMIACGKHRFLFDLESDLGENINLAEQKPQLLREMEASLRQWQDDMKRPAWPSKPNRRTVEIDGIPYEIHI